MFNSIKFLFPDEKYIFFFSAITDAVKVTKLLKVDYRFNAFSGGTFDPTNDKYVVGVVRNNFLGDATPNYYV